jgi:predicted nucleic acid-binding protein
LSTIVLYEWLRGRREAAELAAQEALFPQVTAVPFDSDVARIAADLYRAVPRARGRGIDLAIAATAMAQNASLWTLNIQDFRDIDGLALYDPSE